VNNRLDKVVVTTGHSRLLKWTSLAAAALVAGCIFLGYDNYQTHKKLVSLEQKINNIAQNTAKPTETLPINSKVSSTDLKPSTSGADVAIQQSNTASNTVEVEKNVLSQTPIYKSNLSKQSIGASHLDLKKVQNTDGSVNMASVKSIELQKLSPNGIAVLNNGLNSEKSKIIAVEVQKEIVANLVTNVLKDTNLTSQTSLVQDVVVANQQILDVLVLPLELKSLADVQLKTDEKFDNLDKYQPIISRKKELVSNNKESFWAAFTRPKVQLGIAGGAIFIDNKSVAERDASIFGGSAQALFANNLRLKMSVDRISVGYSLEDSVYQKEKPFVDTGNPDDKLKSIHVLQPLIQLGLGIEYTFKKIWKLNPFLSANWIHQKKDREHLEYRFHDDYTSNTKTYPKDEPAKSSSLNILQLGGGLRMDVSKHFEAQVESFYQIGLVSPTELEGKKAIYGVRAGLGYKF
jgi:hypothetical protein